jgi:hypothetical protein
MHVEYFYLLYLKIDKKLYIIIQESLGYNLSIQRLALRSYTLVAFYYITKNKF